MDIQQLRAARGLLGWTQGDLAERANLSLTSLNQIERGSTTPRPNTWHNLQMVFENAGVEFTPQSGVRFKENKFVSLQGNHALAYLQNDLYETLHNADNREMLVMGVNDQEFVAADSQTMHHYLKIAYPAGIRERVLIAEGDNFFLFPDCFSTYRHMKAAYFYSLPFYTYGNKVAFLIWGKQLQLILIEDKNLAAAFKHMFEAFWLGAKPIVGKVIPALDL